MKKNEAIKLAINLLKTYKMMLGERDFDKLFFSPKAIKEMKRYYQEAIGVLEDLLDKEE